MCLIQSIKSHTNSFLCLIRSLALLDTRVSYHLFKFLAVQKKPSTQTTFIEGLKYIRVFLFYFLQGLLIKKLTPTSFLTHALLCCPIIKI